MTCFFVFSLLAFGFGGGSSLFLLIGDVFFLFVFFWTLPLVPLVYLRHERPIPRDASATVFHRKTEDMFEHFFFRENS